jgi:dephospho-CoA kinase
MVIGITGGIGSGKSYVAECFLKYENTVYYHADAEAKKLMNTSEEIRNKVLAEFGAEAYKDQQLNRPYIANIVFQHPEKLQQLNQIVHPAVKKHFSDFIQSHSKKTFIIYENAILFEANSDQVCDVVILVTAPIATRIKRVMQRDGVTQEEVEKRIQNQWSESRKKLLSNYNILNINKEETLLKVQDIHNILTKKMDLF